MIDYEKTLNAIDAQVTSLTEGVTKELTPTTFEVEVKKAFGEISKMMTADQVVHLGAIRDVISIAKVMSENGSWSDTSSFRFPMLTGPMAVQSMTAWSSQTKRTIELPTNSPSPTNFSDNTPVIKGEEDPWGTGDFNRAKIE